MALAQRHAIASLDALGQRVTPRVLAGAMADAGGLGAYATLTDYQEALGEFIEARRHHGSLGLPGAMPCQYTKHPGLARLTSTKVPGTCPADEDDEGIRPAERDP